MDYFCCEIFVGHGPAEGSWTPETNTEALEAWHARLHAFIAQRTDDFIWNREPLQLFVNTRERVPRVSGRMIHGDAVDDEWLAVWLLCEATRQFEELSVSVNDSDGEFLLAEAAMHIPQWLTPENSANRVFIHKGQLHIVPLAAGSAGADGGPQGASLASALHAVANASDTTRAPAAAEASAFARLTDYPEKMAQSMHRARCRLPVNVARAISAEPQLISAAVELFYARDPLQMRACQRMERFPPEPSTTVSVQFNRIQYAKLASQDIDPPVAFKLPLPSRPEYKASVLGMKVVCGAETPGESGPASADADTGNSKRLDFLNQLERLGHFDERATAPVTASRRHARATRQLTESQSCSAGAPMSEDLLVSRASQVLSGTAAVQGMQSSPPPPADNAAAGSDEDDSWLALDSNELDALMHRAESVLRDTPQDGHVSTGDSDSDVARDLQGVLGKFEAFLTADSGIEGANLME
ncbi:hypothetical protein GGF46_005523 [Coemansia sp. RSA 552]|nr:hypothetical protein GGF46_005523 [Coemansia sp. RSA 552]